MLYDLLCPLISVTSSKASRWLRTAQSSDRSPSEGDHFPGLWPPIMPRQPDKGPSS